MSNYQIVSDTSTDCASQLGAAAVGTYLCIVFVKVQLTLQLNRVRVLLRSSFGYPVV